MAFPSMIVLTFLALFVYTACLINAIPRCDGKDRSQYSINYFFCKVYHNLQRHVLDLGLFNI